MRQNRTKCDECEKEVGEFKFLKKIRKKYLCKECQIKTRLNHRKETFETSEDKEKIKELNNKIEREYREKRKGSKLREYIVGGRPRIKITTPPKIKGSKEEKKKEKSNAYLTFHEKQNLLRILMNNKGLTFEDATERIKTLVEQQAKVRELMRAKGKPEDEIKIKQQKLLEELWKN
jgi:hypothetical protein